MIYNKYLDNDIDEKVGSVINTVKKVVNFKHIQVGWKTIFCNSFWWDDDLLFELKNPHKWAIHFCGQYEIYTTKINISPFRLHL